MDAGVRKELAGEIQEQSVWLMRLMEKYFWNMTKLESEGILRSGKTRK